MSYEVLYEKGLKFNSGLYEFTSVPLNDGNVLIYVRPKSILPDNSFKNNKWIDPPPVNPNKGLGIIPDPSKPSYK